jgi:hypothetical protein
VESRSLSGGEGRTLNIGRWNEGYSQLSEEIAWRQSSCDVLLTLPAVFDWLHEPKHVAWPRCRRDLSAQFFEKFVSFEQVGTERFREKRSKVSIPLALWLGLRAIEKKTNSRRGDSYDMHKSCQFERFSAFLKKSNP